MSKAIFGCLLSALLLSAPFLEPSLFVIAWVAFVPLFWLIEKAASARRAIFQGWLAGTLAYLTGFYWLVYTISVFGGFPYPVSALIFLIYAALQALQMAIFAALVRILGFGPLRIFPALCWVTLEFLFPLLFPWYLANSQIFFPWYVQTADLVGPYGASFVIMWFNAALYKALVAPKEERFISMRPLAYVALAVIVSVFYGFQRTQQIAREMADARKLSVISVQANIGIDMKWNPALAKKNLEKHIQLTAEADTVPLVVWPESSVEFWIPDETQVLPMDLVPPLKPPQAYFVFGARSFTGKLDGPNFKAYNSAFFSDAKGRVLGRYHKQVLLAFGEYMPFARILALLPGIPFADGFTPGRGPLVFHLSGGVRLAPLICYEDLMPDLGRRFVSEAGANVLLNLTNDAWYGRSMGPWQHLRLAQFRAIETRRSLLRVTNTGVTSLVNANGELVQSLPMFSAAVMKSEVDVLEGQTYYVRFGDWFAWGITIIVAALILWRLKRAMDNRQFRDQTLEVRGQ